MCFRIRFLSILAFQIPARWLYYTPFKFLCLHNLLSLGQVEREFKTASPLAWALRPWLQRQCLPVKGEEPPPVRCWSWAVRSEPQTTWNNNGKKKKKKALNVFKQTGENGFYTLTVCEHKVVKSCRQWFTLLSGVEMQLLGVRGIAMVLRRARKRWRLNESCTISASGGNAA